MSAREIKVEIVDRSNNDIYEEDEKIIYNLKLKDTKNCQIVSLLREEAENTITALQGAIKKVDAKNERINYEVQSSPEQD